jgi:hypothetical protein
MIFSAPVFLKILVIMIMIILITYYDCIDRVRDSIHNVLNNPVASVLLRALSRDCSGRGEAGHMGAMPRGGPRILDSKDELQDEITRLADEASQ